MPFTLLIDLDDTLLVNPMESFMPSYLKLLSKKLSPFISPERMVPQLLSTTDKMVASNQPVYTLEQTFDKHFYPPLGLQKQEIEQTINDFYSNDFCELQKVTQVRPEALKLIEYAISQNYTIIVATNPLFPHSAMIARLKWAGFPLSNFPFQFVTSYETMHFAKPNPAYYAEILGRFGWPRTPICMIGNSLYEDIVPPSMFGIPCFWVNGDPSKLPNSIQDLSTVGKMDEVIPWLKELENKPHEIDLRNPSAILALLNATPAVLQSLTRKSSDADWKNKPSPTELSILELISHLLDVETEINLPRIKEVLATENPFITGVDSDIWVKQRNYNETRSRGVLSDFIEKRVTNYHLLAELSAEQWLRPARHSFFGRTSLLELVKFIAIHDMDHIRQVHHLVA